MPEHIHLLIRDPQKKNPSTVMQALKLSFARRVLAQARDEDATPGRVRAESQTAGCPASHPSANAQGKLSQKAREVAHPSYFVSTLKDNPRYTFRVKVAHPPRSAQAPEGTTDFEEPTTSLKRCPDTKPSFAACWCPAVPSSLIRLAMHLTKRPS